MTKKKRERRHRAKTAYMTRLEVRDTPQFSTQTATSETPRPTPTVIESVQPDQQTQAEEWILVDDY
jgi:hypothetical protein